jgi:hypothetical protein
MADERSKDDVEEIEVVPVPEDQEQNRDRGQRSNEMPKEDADQDAQVRQSGDGNVHLGSQRDPDAETSEARRTSTFDNQDTLEAVARDAEHRDGVEEGETSENVNFNADAERGDRDRGEGDGGGERGNARPGSARAQEAGGASEAARAGAPGQAAGGDQGGANGPSSSGNLNPLGQGQRGQQASGPARRKARIATIPPTRARSMARPRPRIPAIAPMMWLKPVPATRR